jgi:hypothetical protein
MGMGTARFDDDTARGVPVHKTVIFKEIKKYYTESRRRGISYIQ